MLKNTSLKWVIYKDRILKVDNMFATNLTIGAILSILENIHQFVRQDNKK